MLKVQPDGLPAGWPALVGCCARAAGFTAAVTHTDRTAATTIRPDIWTSSTLSVRYIRPHQAWHRNVHFSVTTGHLRLGIAEQRGGGEYDYRRSGHLTTATTLPPVVIESSARTAPSLLRMARTATPQCFLPRGRCRLSYLSVDWTGSGACTSGSTAPPKAKRRGCLVASPRQLRTGSAMTAIRDGRSRLARPRCRADFRRHGAADLCAQRRRGHGVFGRAWCVTAERNGPDVRADERFPFDALAETDLPPTSEHSEATGSRSDGAKQSRGINSLGGQERCDRWVRPERLQFLRGR
jgi:hypothetical protein